MSRRSFLGRVALGAATVAVAGTGVLAYRSYDQGVFSAGRGSASHGLAFQHMNQPTERVDREAQLGLAPAAEAALDDLVDQPVQTSLRIGYPTTTPRPSPRRPAEDVLR